MCMFIFGGDSTFTFNYSECPTDGLRTIIIKNDTTSIFDLDSIIRNSVPINWDKEIYKFSPYIITKKEDSLPKIKLK